MAADYHHGSVNGKYTGMKALLSAQTNLSVKPRILAVPGLDSLPIASALVSLAQKLRAFAYVSAHGAETIEEAVLYLNFVGFDSY